MAIAFVCLPRDKVWAEKGMVERALWNPQLEGGEDEEDFLKDSLKA